MNVSLLSHTIVIVKRMINVKTIGVNHACVSIVFFYLVNVNCIE